MAAQVFGTSAVVLQLNQAFRGSAPSNAVFANQKEAVADMGDVAFANAFAADYVPAGADSAEDFVALSNTILGNLNLLPPTTAADKAAELQEALPQLLFAYQDSIGQVILNLTNLMRGLEADPNWGAASALYNQQQAAALTYSSDDDNTGESTGGGGGGSLTLTERQDGLTGSGAADTFTSNVVQNQLGMQVNTLGSGDILDGGGSVDTLMAKIAAGVFAGGSFSMPIQPETESIEIVKLEAVVANIAATSAANNDVVYVNAKDLADVTQLWSYRSDADLVIQNMTTKGLNQLSDMTIGMAYTGNADSRWGESDYTVYFDQDYLTPEATSSNPTIDILAMNEDAYDETDGALPLAGVWFRELTVTVNGVRFDLTQYLDEDSEGPGTKISTYDDLVSAVQAALVELKADNPGNAALQTLTAEEGVAFKTDVDPVTLIQRVGTTVRLSIDGLTNGVANTLTVESQDLEVARSAASEYENNNRYERADNDPATPGEVLAINVALEKVGLAGDGGELIIGSMNKTSDNEWDAVTTTTDTTSGIEQFNVTVYGAADKASSLSGMHSTNNNLRVVNVVTDAAQTGTFADLTIGNSNTAGIGDIPSVANANALKDVQTFDASGLDGDLTLFAALTDEVTAKYLDVVDDAADATADNVDFAYTGGTGDDYINLYLDGSNLAQPGTSSREDMTLTVNGGAGDDEIVTFISDDATDNWYVNQQINANLSIGLNNTVATGQLQLNGGDGADTIRNLGTGDFAINGGAGNDTVYSDNTGDRSTWTINAVNNNPADLQSEPAVPAATGIANLFLNVSFKGYDAKVAVGGSNGSMLGVSVTDLTINQAIKDAINNDAVLNKLLIAEDGPGRTLVITSLIDGDQSGLDDINDVVISLSSTALTAGQALNAAQLSGPEAFALGFGTGVNSLAYAAVNGGRFDANDTGAGDDSAATSDSLIVGGTGDDVIVLSTGADSNEGVGYTGFGNGTDYIVNFVATEEVTTVVDVDNPVTVEVTTQGVAAVAAADPIAATFELKVSAASAAGNVVFTDSAVGVAFGDLGAGNLSVAVLATDTAAQVATKIVAAWAGVVGTADYTVAVDPLDASNLIFTERTPTGSTTPDQAILLAAVDGSTAGVLETVENITVGSFGTAAVLGDTEEVTVTFGAPTINGLFQFDGDEYPILLNDTPEDVADTFVAGTFTNWTAVKAPFANFDGTWSVVLTSTTANAAVADVTLADFTGDINLNGVTVITQELMPDSDYLDFSSYGLTGTTGIVDGVVIGTLNTALTGTYINLVESTTNDGSYTINYVNLGATTATTDNVAAVLVGIADFGVEQDFVAENFVV